MLSSLQSIGFKPRECNNIGLQLFKDNVNIDMVNWNKENLILRHKVKKFKTESCFCEQ